MVFSTIIFMCAFLPLVIIGYYITPSKAKNIFLLCASLFFYAFGEPAYVFLMLLSILINYIVGLLLHYRKHKKFILITGLVLNLLILCVFKYANFILDNVTRLGVVSIKIPEIILPIGISFYTFQGISYIIDIYRNEKERIENSSVESILQTNPINLALYIAMFPQLIAGPIVRYEDIRSYLSNRKHSLEIFAMGMERFIVGLSKKAILANSMGELANAIMGSNMTYLSLPNAWLGAIAYSLQIYFDFSGYSDMAIGLGAIFGFHFNENFQYPYIARSMRDFWKRWHISLSSWFRDYLYIPLGGNRKGNVYLHLFIVFAATGLWHGAAWGFVLWGLWHGGFLIIERAVGRKKFSIPTWLQSTFGHLYTLFVVIVGWVLFYFVDLEPTVQYLKIMFGITRNEMIAYDITYYLTNKTLVLFVISIAACFPYKKIQNTILRRILLLILLMMCFTFVITSTYNPFIYFRF